MSLKTFLKAAFKTRNFALMAGVVIAILILSSQHVGAQFLVPLGLVGLAGYIYFIIQTIGSEGFKNELKLGETMAEIEKLSYDCDDIYREINKKINKDLRNKAITIIKKKDELMKYFKDNSEDPIKQRIIEQAFKLVAAYLKLVYHYSVRSDEISSVRVNELVARINLNNRKLGSLKSYEAVL
ncbi:MAG: hypothetical protein HGA22_11950, partial [Clostridiales bacterium]|nr:hypothetical protein [Clostridiales bacterium]